jgi:chemotaxis protein methyltransferase CheR
MNDTLPLGHVRLSTKEFRVLGEFIQREAGIKMPPVKQTMLQARLQKRLRSLGLKSFSEYREYLFSPDGLRHEMRNMLDAVTTNKTDFFREPTHFTYLTDVLLPGLAQTQRAGYRRPLMTWSAGCSSGEEPYTLAMVLSEFAERTEGFTFRILATDVSSRVLESARTAIYKEQRAEPVPEELKRKYLLRSRDRAQGLVRVVPDLRRLVNFRHLNFMDDTYEMDDSMDIIFCRNVMIYFDRPTQERLIRALCKHLVPGGYVFIGHSETLNGLNVPLLQEAPTIYRKTT